MFHDQVIFDGSNSGKLASLCVCSTGCRLHVVRSEIIPVRCHSIVSSFFVA